MVAACVRAARRRCRGQRRCALQGHLQRRMELAYRPGGDQHFRRSAAQQRAPRPGRRRQPAAAAGLLAGRAEKARRHRRCATVAGQPGELRDLSRANRQLRGQPAIHELANAVQQRFGVLVGHRLRAGRRPLAHGPRLRPVPRPAKPDSGVLRPADREHACRARARLQRAAGRAGRSRRVDRRRRRTERPDPEQLLRPVQASAGRHPDRPGAGAAGPRVATHPRRRDTRLRETADLLPHGVPATGAQHAGGRGTAGRQGVLSPADPRVHHPRSRPRRRSTRSVWTRWRRSTRRCWR